MLHRSEKEFSWVEGLTFAIAAVGMAVSGEVIHQWGAYFYSPSQNAGRTIYVAVSTVGTIFFVGMVFDAITDPLVGIWSDRTGTRPSWYRLVPIAGRRRPFIFWGSILMTVTGIAFWYPPVQGESGQNFLYGAMVICLHWLFLTIYSVPLNSLGPEIARSRESRVKLGMYLAAGMMIGITCTAVLPGIMIDALDPARHVEPPTYSDLGYQRTAIILCGFALLLLQVPAWVLRERHRPVQDEARMPPLGQLLAALKNRVFLIWIAAMVCFNIGFLAVQKTLPYWVEVSLGGDETTVSLLMGPFVGAALLALPLMSVLSKRIPNKWLLFLAMALITLMMPGLYVIAVLPCSVTVKTLLAVAAFSLVGIGQGALFMLYMPLIGEIIDLDERLTGERREGVYCGLSGVSWKSGQALAVYVATIPMDIWGNSIESPMGILLVGPIASLFGLVALCIVWFYPVLQDSSSSD
jgi:GPH family glycoside/pentoside/hexuronide:cation symporter